ncbi:MAG: hypothetical protein J6K89_00170 [Oscillospiraceae bacterium]|nr:hypothetical protein [Oscillospiraceae bacterium]
MTGKYTIRVKNNRVRFELTVERNITILRGDSATGKTTLLNLLRAYEEYGKNSGVSVDSPKPCVVLSGPYWEAILERVRDSIVFIDENSAFVASPDFAKAVQKYDNYYVIVTRENLPQIPYSVSSILKLRKTTSRKKLTYNKAYPLYNQILNAKVVLNTSALYLTEDSRSGYELFSAIAVQNNAVCQSTYGNAGVLKLLQSLERQKTLIIADGAAFGPYINGVFEWIKHRNHFILYLPESLEWLILRSSILRDPEIQGILDNPQDYIDSSRHFSWEQFFTELLIRKTADTYMSYQKSHLNPFYLQSENIDKIISTIEK